MSIRNILLFFEEGEVGDARLETAVSLSRQLGALLTGLYVVKHTVPDPAAATRTGQPAAPQPKAYEMERQAESREEARTCRRTFERAARIADIEADWNWATEEPVGALSRHALYADLVVTGRGKFTGKDSSSDGLADRLVTRIACPLLMLPEGCPTRLLGQRILVAWAPDFRAQRAVQAALPLLRRANRVDVLTVKQTTSALVDGQPQGREVRKYLARHAVPIEYRSLAANGRKTGETILGHAADLEADLIVMGAYHHSRLREVLLGGVTRHVLQQATLPVLVAH